MKRCPIFLVIFIYTLCAIHIPLVLPLLRRPVGARVRSVWAVRLYRSQQGCKLHALQSGGIALKNPEVSYMYSKLYTGLDAVNLRLNYTRQHIPFKKVGVFPGYPGQILFRRTRVRRRYYFAFLCRKLFKEKASAGINIKYLSHRFTLDKRTVLDPVFSDGTSKGAVSLDPRRFIEP